MKHYVGQIQDVDVYTQLIYPTSTTKRVNLFQILKKTKKKTKQKTKKNKKQKNKKTKKTKQKKKSKFL